MWINKRDYLDLKTWAEYGKKRHVSYSRYGDEDKQAEKRLRRKEKMENISRAFFVGQQFEYAGTIVQVRTLPRDMAFPGLVCVYTNKEGEIKDLCLSIDEANALATLRKQNKTDNP